jgi:hypothetical protein
MAIDPTRDFLDLPWRRAVLLDLRVEHRGAGYVHTVSLSVVWPGGRRTIVSFREPYALDARLSFGIVVPDTVSKATVGVRSAALDRIRHVWTRLGAPPEDLRCFALEMASTGSVKVYASEWSARAVAAH